ncbi:caspase, EACC1-associated type [Dactylosporangium salmoneum]|uniref:Caspase domain-containing protein n=1 Tax=Dactylosporangium salmoneum TaxID=53361 RepID=A0ABN3HMS5_9ACTN
MRLPDPARSTAILVGSSRFHSADLNDLPAVRNNVDTLAAVLASPTLGGFNRRRCVVVHDPVGVFDLYRQIRGPAVATEDTLLIYYAGHGLTVGLRHELHLALRDTDPEAPGVSAFAFDHIRDIIQHSPAKNRILILDCCFSGLALTDAQAGGAEAIVGQISIGGTYTLTATPATGLAIAPVGAQYTAFTEQLLRLLSDGIPNGPAFLAMSDVYRHLHYRTTALGLPIPRQQGSGTVDALALTHNPAYGTAASPALALARDPADLLELARGEAQRESESIIAAARLEAQEITEKARIESVIIKATAGDAAGNPLTAAEREAAEVRAQARRDADTLRADAERETKQLRTATAHEVVEFKATVDREVATLRATTEREITQLRAKAAREAEEKIAEATKLLTDARDKRDKDLQSLALEIAERQETAEHDESARHASAVAATRKLVTEAEGRARAAEDRAKEIEQRAETRRVESERSAAETIDKAKDLADKTVNEARAEAHRLLSEARAEAEETTQRARREVEDLTRQKDAVTSQLGQMLSGLAGLAPSVQSPQR